jgi:hypothetical protein
LGAFPWRRAVMGAIEERPTRPELADVWLPLLRELTERFPAWAVWKNPESAFDGPGDIDSMAPPEQWAEIEATFKAWARERGMRPIIVCRHVPQGPHFVAVEPGWPHLLILDVKRLSTWRGSTLIGYRQLAEVTIVDERGFRRIRPGAEGVVKLMLNGVLLGGRPNWEGLRTKGVADLLAADPEGVSIVANWFGPLAGSVRNGVDAYLRGGWDRRSMAMTELYAGAMSFLEPMTALSRLVFKRTIKDCEILQSIRRNDRHIPDPAEAWYRKVALNHEVDMDPRG